MDALAEFFSRDRLAKRLGMEVVSYGEGRAVVRMLLTPEHCNGLGTGHGGAIFSLADFAFAIACNSRARVAVALTATISYMKAAKPGNLLAAAEEVSLGAKTGTYLVKVTDEAGDMVALFQGTAYRKKETLEEAL